MQDSPIQAFSFKGLDFFIKRDDLLDKYFSGNKARKFSYLLKNPPLHVNAIVSYGSNQSNAMYSLSVLSKKLNKDFIYFTHHLPKYLQNNPIGNYKMSIENGMKIILSQNPELEYLNYKDKNVLHVKEGGAMKWAKFGIKQLAHEIKQWSKDKVFDIFLPSGTGTTALYLQKYLDFKVYTCPCVGDEIYLKKQFLELNKNEKEHPIILKSLKKYHFGKPKKELYDIYKQLKDQTNIEFDLLYDSVGWISLLENINIFKHKIIYIHQGGLLGNISLLQRYEYKKYT